MEEKLRFVFDYERDEETMADLCARYGIARETGYVWLRRYRERGVAGLVELNRAAERHPNQTPAEIEQAVLELRQAHNGGSLSFCGRHRQLGRRLSRQQPDRRETEERHHPCR